MSKWVCYECGGTNVWELSWVRANRISWMLEYDEDVYTDYLKPRTRCDDCNDEVILIEKEIDDG
jgi:hypothetical protein